MTGPDYHVRPWVLEGRVAGGPGGEGRAAGGAGAVGSGGEGRSPRDAGSSRGTSVTPERKTDGEVTSEVGS